MTTETITMPFRCAACGPIDCVNLVKDASVWYRVRMDAGAIIADADFRSSVRSREPSGSNAPRAVALRPWLTVRRSS